MCLGSRRTMGIRDSGELWHHSGKSSLASGVRRGVVLTQLTAL